MTGLVLDLIEAVLSYGLELGRHQQVGFCLCCDILWALILSDLSSWSNGSWIYFHSTHTCLILTVFWHIWKARNNFCFNSLVLSYDSVARVALFDFNFILISTSYQGNLQKATVLS